MKSYQEEIDRLTMRAKSSEKMFVDIYKALHNTPDPVPLLEMALTMSRENIIFKQELKENDDEFKTLTNQDVTIRKLETQLEELQNAQEIETNSKIDDARQNFELLLIEKDATIDELEKQLKISQNDSMQTQSLLEERDAEREHMEEMYINEIQRMENVTVKPVSFEKAPCTSDEDRKRVLEIEDELLRRQNVETILRQEIWQLKSDIVEIKDLAAKELTEKNEENSKCWATIFSLERDISERPTIEAFAKLEKQLRMLHNSESPDDEFEGDAKLIFGRMRQLESTCSQLRVENALRSRELQVMLQSKTDLEAKVSKQVEIVRVLDHGGNNTAADVLRRATQEMDTQPKRDVSFLNIVQQQRNDFRKRMLELEVDRDKLAETIKDQNLDIETLRNDNSNLFQKIRYSANTKITSKKMKGISAPEKFTLNAVGFFMSTRTTRLLLLGYLLLLHFLVFSTLVLTTHVDSTVNKRLRTIN